MAPQNKTKKNRLIIKDRAKTSKCTINRETMGTIRDNNTKIDDIIITLIAIIIIRLS